MTMRTWSWEWWSVWNWSNAWIRPFSFPNTILVDWVVSPEQWEMTLSSTNVWTIALFRSKATFQWKTNKVKAWLLAYEFHVDVPAWNVTWEVVFQIVWVQTLSGAWSYSSINSNSSVMEYDHTPWTWASVELSTWVPILTKTITYIWSNKWWVSWTAAIDAESLWAVAYLWDQFAIIAKDLWWNNVKVRCNLNWEELF